MAEMTVGEAAKALKSLHGQWRAIGKLTEAFTLANGLEQHVKELEAAQAENLIAAASSKADALQASAAASQVVEAERARVASAKVEADAAVKRLDQEVAAAGVAAAEKRDAFISEHTARMEVATGEHRRLQADIKSMTSERDGIEKTLASLRKRIG